MAKHAFLIIAHNEPEVLKVLLQQLDDERNDVFLHIDAKSEELYRMSQTVEMKRGKLFILKNRLHVYWGHTSQVKVEMLLLQEASSHGRYAYYHLLSGTDLPIKTQDEIHAFFDANQGKEFVGFWNSETHLKDAQRKMQYYYLSNRYKHTTGTWKHRLNMPIRNILLVLQKLILLKRKHEGIDIKKGYNWFSITDDCCRYVLKTEEWIRRQFRYTMCADEIFLQTVLWNSPFRDKLYDIQDVNRGSTREIDWERGNPYVWTIEDMESLLQSECMFARKFSSKQMDAVNAISKHLADCRSSL